MRTLYGLAQSPYTEKARWALDHHAIAYRYHEHVPMLGEVFLRLKARGRPTGTKASVPLLVDGPDVLPTSLAIARYADRVGRNAALFPEEQLDEILRWADLSDRILDIGRARVMEGLRTNPEAQREALPSFIPGVLRGALAPMAVSGGMFLAAKYHIPKDAKSRAEFALAWACGYGRTEAARFLLEHGVSPASADSSAMTALHWAAGHGYMDLVDLLLKRGAPLEVRNEWGGTVLSSTIWFARQSPMKGADYPAVVEKLVAAGADISQVNHPTGDARIDRVLRS